MQRLKAPGVGVRLLLPAAVLTAVLTAALIVLQLTVAARGAEESVDHYADLVGRTVLDGVHDAMLADDRPRLKRQLKRFANSEYVRRIDIIDKTGEVIFSSDPDARGEVFTKDSESCTPCHAQAGAPSATGKSARVKHATNGATVFRSVQPIAAELECLECHEKAKAGQIIGVLVTDLDEAKLTRGVLSAARTQSWALAAAFALFLGSIMVVTRFLVVGRLRNVKRLLDFVREGTQTTALASESFAGPDEIDEIERLVHSVAEDVQGRQAIDRAVQGLASVLARCREPVVLLDQSLRVVGANPAYLDRPGSAGPGTQLQTPGVSPQSFAESTREHGWSLGSAADEPLLAAVDDARGAPLLWAEIWSDAGLEATERPPAPRPSRADPEWQLYTAALATCVSREAKRWRGVQQLDRRLNSGRRLMTDLAAHSTQLFGERAPVDLRALLPLVLWDLHRQVPDVSWHALLEEELSVLGLRYQLRALVQRLAQSAAAQAGPGGHAVLFSQRRASTGKIYLGAWAASAAPPVSVDAVGRLPLTALLARAHGGGVEVDPAFDLAELCAQRGVTLPCPTRGVLFVAELDAR